MVGLYKATSNTHLLRYFGDFQILVDYYDLNYKKVVNIKRIILNLTVKHPTTRQAYWNNPIDVAIIFRSCISIKLRVYS